MFCAIWEFAQCQDCAAHSQNPEIACQSWDCALGLHNLESEWHQCAISRLSGTSAQSWDSAISVACIIEPFKFPSYIKVRDVRNKLLQLRRHLQCRACILKPPHQGLLGSLPTRRNSPRSGYGCREIPDQQSAPIQGIAISENSQLSSVSQLGCSHSVSPLCSQTAQDCANVLCNSEIAQTYCALSRLAVHNLKIGAQFQDSENAQRNLEIAQIPR